jgi:hypothetical protein
MAEQWIVRVQDREYGPVGVEELREWRREGRLIRENQVREPDSERWFPAGELPEIFADEPDLDPSTAVKQQPAERRLSFGEIVVTSWIIYSKGFSRFVALAALVALPAAILQLAAPFLESPKPGESMTPVMVSAAIVFLMLVALVISWPFSFAGMQLLAADLLSGHNPSLRELFARAKPLWTRMLALGFVVYGSYLLWTLVPLLVALSLLAGPVSLFTIFLSFGLLLFIVYMVARLFINFLFWQQAGALGNLDTMEALRESKELARSGRHLPWTQRPLYRGALIASVWLLVVIALNFAISLPLIFSKWEQIWKLQEVANIDQAMSIAQSVSPPHSLDFLTCITTLLSSLAQAVLRPWLAAIFVVLYLDTKRAQERLPHDQERRR